MEKEVLEQIAGKLDAIDDKIQEIMDMFDPDFDEPMANAILDLVKAHRHAKNVCVNRALVYALKQVLK